MKRWIVVVGVLLVVILVVALQPHEDSIGGGGPQPTSAATVPETAPTVVATGGVPTGADEIPPQPSSLTPAQQQEVVLTATEAIRRFARPGAGVSRQSWWSRLAPMLTDSARSVYADVDPATVPFTAVTGAGELDPQQGMTQSVRVPTDGGVFTVVVTVLHPSGDAEFLVVRFEFPA